ncbi:MAG TPA: cache domain-containing protein [Burkholderiaceae bacterium]|jgi:signal transduction histidine kinase
MQNIVRALTLFALTYFLFSIHSFAADDRGTAKEAVAMVHKVIANMKREGKDKVITEINSLTGQYRDRDLYVSVLDMNGLELAHGANKRMQGINLMELKDIDGKAYMHERYEILKKNGKGWQDYKFVNPVTKQLEMKSMYFEKYDGLVISCGIYKANLEK